MLSSPGFILLVIILIVTWLVSRPATKAVDEARAELSADDLKTFNDRYRRPSDRTDMPTRFNDYAEATTRASRIWLTSAGAITITLFWIIFAGPGLGLFPYP